MKKRTKTLLLCGIIFIVASISALGIWFITSRSPVGNGNVLNVAWYHENGTEFTISTVEELYELAALSEHYDFKDQTIKLGADIIVNEGNAADWEFTYPERLWEPIDGFAGTFDGQGHTISGICGMGDRYTVDGTGILYWQTGLFKNTQTKCVIKNFKLVNSFFLSDLNEGVGSITSNGGGTFDSIYSDAIIVSYKCNNGGLIGMLDAKGSSSVTNCWFDGEIRVEGNYGRYNGGIVGRVCETGGQNKIEHCLNTGKLSSTVTGKGINMGGIIGNVAPAGRVNVTDCLAVGDLSNEYGVSVGTVIGCIETNGSATITDVYGRKESFKNIVGAVLGGSIGTPIGFEESMLTGDEGYRWTNLDFENYWTIVEDGTPILQSFADKIESTKGIKKAFNLDWYDKNKKECVISTKEDLYGFAILSYSTNFLGKTIKLGADISMNKGDAKDWAEKSPESIWIPIGTVSAPFAGVFDGDMHTISGICYKTEEPYAGMFPTTSATTTIKNLKLTNSYFESSAQYLGAITGNARGKFETIYSDAIVVSSGGIVGGMIGQVAKDGGVAMTDCWFDGTVLSKGNTTAARRAAGMIGFVLANTALTNCLNTGVIDASAYTTQNSATNKTVAPLAGGLVGHIYKDRTLTVTDCMGTGLVKISDAATAGFGSVIGYSDGTTIISGVYATKEACDKASGGSVNGLVKVVDKAEISGYKGYQWTHLDFENHWAAVVKPSADTPILKAFATETPSVQSVKRMIDISWYDKTKDVYTIDSKEDLYGFALLANSTNFEGKTIRLGKNIVVNTGEAKNWNQGAPTYEWTAIGTSKYPFAGTFDGKMYTISGLYQNTEERYGGLFSVLADKAVVKNLRLENSYFESSVADLGSVVGWSKGTIDTVYSNAIVNAKAARIGGIVGQINGSNVVVKNCWFDGRVTNMGNSKEGRQTGGIAGVAHAGKLTMSNCLNTGVVDASAYRFDHNTSSVVTIAPLAGGLIGYIVKGMDASISDSLATGRVLYSNVANGGYGTAVGYSEVNVKITNSYAIDGICKSALDGKSEGSFEVVPTSKISGVKGYQWTLLDFQKYWAVVTNPTNGTPILKSFAKNIPSLAGVEKMIDISWYDAQKTTYVLNDVGDLYGFAYLSANNNFAGKTVKLGADIVINKTMTTPEHMWTPIGSSKLPFAGNFDGAMHSIKGLYLMTDESYVGLFSATGNTATVKNLKLEDSYIKTSGTDCGSIAGRGNGNFETIYSNATVISSNARVGGLIGQGNGSDVKVKNCWFDGSVTNTSNHQDKRGTGGIIGIMYEGNVTIDNCLNTGNVDTLAYTNVFPAGNVIPVVGGFIGRVMSGAKVTINDSLNTGEIAVSSSVTTGYGSIVGYTDKANAVSVSDVYVTIESCSQTAGSTISGRVFAVEEQSIKGYSGYQWTMLDFDKYWAVNLSGTPVLKSFAKEVPSIADVDKMIDLSWYDEEKDVYVLEDKGDLYGFAMLSSETDYKGKTIKLGKDIIINEGNASDWAKSAPNYVWTAVGTKAVPFAGVFDGEMHTISGIYMNTTVSYSGFFGAIGGGATVRNLKIKNSYFKSTASDFGSVAGLLAGTIDTVYSEAIVHGSNTRIGGFVGIASGSNAKINNCMFAGTVKNTGNTNALRGTAGFVGNAYSGKLTMSNCLNVGSVDVSAYTYKFPGTNVIPVAGGFVGQARSGVKIVITDSLNTGAVVTSDAVTLGYGPIMGYSDKTDSTTTTNTFATKESCAVTNKSNMTATVTQVTLANIKGDAAKTNMAGLDWNDTWVAIDYLNPVLRSFKDEVYDVDWYKEDIDTYLLRDRADLYGFAVLSRKTNFAGKTISLSSDIALNVGNAKDWATVAPGFEWLPISTKAMPFAGTFDGGMYTISGIYINEKTNSNVGLFSTTKETSTVKNLKITNSYLTSVKDNIGSVVGQLRGTMEAVYSNAIVTGSNARVGGLVGMGYTTSVVVSKCWFDGSVSCTGNHKNYRGTGAIMGCLYDGGKMTMTNCLNTGTIDVTAYNFNQSANSTPNVTVIAGGLVGWVKSSSSSLSVDKCLNVGELFFDESVTGGYGLIVGFKEGTVTMKNTYATTGEWTTEEIAKSYMISSVKQVKDTELKGDLAKTTLKEFDFETVWATVSEEMPMLKVFQ